MNTQKQIFLIVVLFFMFTAGCAAYAVIDLPYRADIQEEYQYEGRVERGALLYANNCRTCHGNSGEGFVGPPVNKEEWQNQDPLVLQANQALIRRTLQCGRAGTLMPAWLRENGGSLSRIQIEHLVELLTSPATEENPEDPEGPKVSKGWLEAEEFAHNLNHELTALVGGDTLSNIAKAHNIGPRELFEYNQQRNRLKFQEGQAPGINAFLERGSKIILLPNKTDPDGHEYQIRQDNETIAKIADSQSVGAAIIADLNNLDYEINYKRSSFHLKENGREVAGLFPGTELKLPQGATYTITAGDTLRAIAERHNVSVADLRRLNPNTFPTSVGEEDELEAVRTLELGANPRVFAAEGDTYATIAAAHGIEDPAELARLNNGQVGDILPGGKVVNLPAGAEYRIQPGDTIASVAQKHGLQPADLARTNNLDVNAELSDRVIIQLPQVDRFVVRGQTLEEVAEGYGNVTAESLAEANGLERPDLILRIGEQLRLPEDAYGTAPPDAINDGKACVEHAVPGRIYEEIFGGAETPTPPASTANQVQVEGNANDWVVIADGNRSAPNEGVVAVARGTRIPFLSVQGLHTVTINGEQEGDDINTGQRIEVTFSEAGQFKITCDYHPDMIAWIFVQ